MYQLIKKPLGRNKKSGNVTLTNEEWYALTHGLYSTILVIRDKHTTKVYQVEEWMMELAREVVSEDGERSMLVPVSKGSPLYRSWLAS